MLLSFLFFQKINNLGNFFKNVLRLVSAIWWGGVETSIALHPILCCILYFFITRAFIRTFGERNVTHKLRGKSSRHPGRECLGLRMSMSLPQILSCQCGEQNYSTNIMTRGYKYPSDLAVWNRLGWLRGESLSNDKLRRKHWNLASAQAAWEKIYIYPWLIWLRHHKHYVRGQ